VTDVLLMLIVIGLLVLALGLDIAAVIAWARGRWR
jgi:hypothetical protein